MTACPECQQITVVVQCSPDLSFSCLRPIDGQVYDDYKEDMCRDCLINRALNGARPYPSWLPYYTSQLHTATGSVLDNIALVGLGLHRIKPTESDDELRARALQVLRMGGT